MNKIIQITAAPEDSDFLVIALDADGQLWGINENERYHINPDSKKDKNELTLDTAYELLLEDLTFDVIVVEVRRKAYRFLCKVKGTEFSFFLPRAVMRKKGDGSLYLAEYFDISSHRHIPSMIAKMRSKKKKHEPAPTQPEPPAFEDDDIPF